MLTRDSFTRAPTWGLALALLTPLLGCEAISGTEDPEFPTAELAEVALVEYPSYDKIGAYFCYDLIEDTFLRHPCELLGSRPKAETLSFSFEPRFDLQNTNTFPVPLVEMALTLSVFKGGENQELGQVCVSFCDPESGECQERADPCAMPEDAQTELEDLVPTVDELVALAGKAASGELLDKDNWGFRVIPPQGPERCGADLGELPADCEATTNDAGEACQVCPDDRFPGQVQARVRFDLGINAMLDMIVKVVEKSVDSLLTGGELDFKIPYQVQGTLFFDIPVLGRFALEFGPFDGTWDLN